MKDDILTNKFQLSLQKWSINHLWVEMNLYANLGTDPFSRLIVMRRHTYIQGLCC